jgi:hypothetical protein
MVPAVLGMCEHDVLHLDKDMLGRRSVDNSAGTTSRSRGHGVVNVSDMLQYEVVGNGE